MTTTETETEQDQATDQPRTLTGYMVRHHDGSFIENALLEKFNDLVVGDTHDGDDVCYCVEVYFSHDLAGAVRLERGWSDDADIIPVQIPARAHTIDDQTPAGRLVRMRHELARMRNEMGSMWVADMSGRVDEIDEVTDALTSAMCNMVMVEQAMAVKA